MSSSKKLVEQLLKQVCILFAYLFTIIFINVSMAYTTHFKRASVNTRSAIVCDALHSFIIHNNWRLS